MTTQTTGTAPLIERLVDELVTEVYRWTGAEYTDLPTHIRNALTAALADGIWIESREQARERVQQAVERLSGEWTTPVVGDESAYWSATIIAALRAAPERTEDGV